MNESYESVQSGLDVDASYLPIQDDCIAQDQYAAVVGRARYESSEKQLLLAILTDAVRCVSQHKWSQASSDALNWIVEPDQDAFCSFDNICEVLGLEPAYVRRGILAEVASVHSIPIRVDAIGPGRKVIPIRVAA